MEPPDLMDDALSREGLALQGTPSGRILLIACGALAREVLALKNANGWDHMVLTCLPAIWHNHPERIPAGVEKVVLEHRDAFESIYVVYADCGTGGLLKATCDRLGVEMVPGPHCYAFFEGLDAFSRHEDEITAFYLTDFLVRQFDAFVWRPLGLDRHPELRDMYFAHYTKLVYLAQTKDPALEERARDCARRLELEYEFRPTGYGDLETVLAALPATG